MKKITITKKNMDCLIFAFCGIALMLARICVEYMYTKKGLNYNYNKTLASLFPAIVVLSIYNVITSILLKIAGRKEEGNKIAYVGIVVDILAIVLILISVVR